MTWAIVTAPFIIRGRPGLFFDEKDRMSGSDLVQGGYPTREAAEADKVGVYGDGPSGSYNELYIIVEEASE